VRDGKELPVLALNCGSSSLKFGLYLCQKQHATLAWEGEAEEIGRENSSFWATTDDGKRQKERINLPNHVAALAYAIDVLKRCNHRQPEAIGHRFVHGGPKVREHQLATASVVEQLRAAIAYAPLHVPAALSVLEATKQKIPGVAQVICLDTAFHRSMADVSKTFAFPDEIRELGIERYGFHGLSLESIIPQLDRLPKRLVIAHLGNGASVTAIRDGKSIDTTMGLTPTGGVMMGTRCGDLDPGVLLYLLRNGYSDASKLEDLFDHRSGLLGISGKSSDVRKLLTLRKQDTRVDLALRMFCYQARKAIAAMSAALGGIDALIFTGGIGENAAEVRNEICSGLGFLDKFQIMVIPAQENLQIARITAQIVL